MIDYKIKYIYLKNLYNNLKQNNQNFTGNGRYNRFYKNNSNDIMVTINNILDDINKTIIETKEQFSSFIDDIETLVDSSINHFILILKMV